MGLFTLSQAARWLDAPLIGHDAPITGVGSDSRTLAPGELFVALAGPRFDGHDHLAQASAAGAAGALVAHRIRSPLPQIPVADTLTALGRLASAWRGTRPGRMVAVTGSNGKTTTKEMIATLLGRAGPVLATRGNLNNAIGVPLTLLRGRDEPFLVVEMGANHPGEIAALSALARPHVALITNAGRAHLEGFGSLEGVARAKGEIFEGLGPDGVCVINTDDPGAPLWRELAGSRRALGFGTTATAEVRLEAVEQPLELKPEGFHSRVRVRTPRGLLHLELALAGHHNLLNVLASLAAAEALGLDQTQLTTGLSGLRPMPGRLCPRSGCSGARLIDDSYNANPDSVRAALAVLRELPGRRWLVLGDLAELGPEAEALHREIGREARLSGLDRLWATGPLSAAAVAAFGEGGRLFADRAALVAGLAPALGPQDLVLVKGSRSAAMDQVVTALCTTDKG